MQTKLIEIRDHATCIIALAVCPDAPSHGNAYKSLSSEQLEAERWAWERSGYTLDWHYVLLFPIDPDVTAGGSGHKSYDSEYGDRTWTTVHRWLIKHFGEIESGAVVDVRVILGETDTPVESDRLRHLVKR